MSGAVTPIVREIYRVCAERPCRSDLNAKVYSQAEAAELAIILRCVNYEVKVFRWYDASEAKRHHYASPGYKETML